MWYLWLLYESTIWFVADSTHTEMPWKLYIACVCVRCSLARLDLSGGCGGDGLMCVSNCLHCVCVHIHEWTHEWIVAAIRRWCVFLSLVGRRMNFFFRVCHPTETTICAWAIISSIRNADAEDVRINYSLMEMAAETKNDQNVDGCRNEMNTELIFLRMGFSFFDLEIQYLSRHLCWYDRVVFWFKIVNK